MQAVEDKWNNFKVLWRLGINYNKYIVFWLLVKMVVSTLVPFAQLLTMSQVIAWLTTGVSIEDYLSNLIGWMAGLVLLMVVDAFLENKFDYFSETFRISLTSLVVNQQTTLDYPLIIGEKGNKQFLEAFEMLDNRQTTLGRVFDEWLAIGTAVLSVILYVGTLLQLEMNFIILIGIIIIGLILLKRRNTRIFKQQYPLKVKNAKQFRYLSNVIGDNRVAKDIRLYHMKEWFQDIKAQVIDDYYANNQPLRKHKMVEKIFITLALIFLSAMAYIRSVQLIMSGELVVSQFVVYVGLVTLVTTAMMNLITHLTQFNMSLEEIKGYRNFMEQETVFNHGEGVPMPPQIEKIEFIDVNFTYPSSEQPAIREFNLTIDKNENLAIVGENGAGKTTLVKLLMGLLQPNSGEIRINGYPQHTYNIKDLYTMFAPIFQDSYAFTFTIREAIVQGLAYEEAKYQKVLRDSGMAEIIADLPQGDETPYVKETHFDAVQLSGGQMQKLKLAQALYKEAPVLVLDEPTAALDPIAESKVYQNYERLSVGKITLFISHRLASTRFCDRVIYMEEGLIAESGTHEELLECQGKYYDLFETQAFYYRQPEAEQLVEEIGGII